MRAVLSCVLALVAIGAFLASGSASGDVGLRPSLTVTVPGAVVVSGARFRPHERVTLRFVVNGEPSLKVI